VVTVEENVLRGGFGSQVASLLQHRGLTEVKLRSLGIADEFVGEPLGGAHHEPARMYDAVRERVAASLDELVGVDPNELVERRYARVRDVGVFEEGAE
jgi:acetyl-CoA carboxylase carboxyl transferase subunit alpha